jgi:hypothetical protein
LTQPVREYKRQSHNILQDPSYIFRLAIEADQRAFAGVQVLGGGNGGGEEREWAAQDFEARIYKEQSQSHVDDDLYTSLSYRRWGSSCYLHWSGSESE